MSKENLIEQCDIFIEQILNNLEQSIENKKFGTFWSWYSLVHYDDVLSKSLFHPQIVEICKFEGHSIITSGHLLEISFTKLDEYIILQILS